MLGIVRVALSRPYTFIVLALLILIIGPLAALRTPTDIFPEINIPIIAVAWQYTGLPPDQMSGRMNTPFERALTTTVNDVEHIEANSYTGFGIVKIFFHSGVNIATANAQVTAIAQSMLKNLPAGSQPPLIVNYSASTVPILQLALSGKGLTEQTLADLAMNQLRTRLVSVPGAAIPYPFGGKSRQVQIDLDSAALQARGLTGQDVANVLAAQNLLTPVGTQKIGNLEYAVNLNNAPPDIADLGNLPIKTVNGAMVYVRDVANVRDGSAVQTNIVHVDGGRSVLMSVFKNGATSTLDIIDGIKHLAEELKPTLPDALEIKAIGDQSMFVRNAINGVIKEGIIAAALTSLMILLFLGSWRSTLIVATSIPLSILGAIITLAAMGQTLNIMTLGGLALAVGILVDEATVTIESINWHLEQGKDVEEAILDGSAQIVVPAFVSLLCICIVFVPMFFLEGVARFLFVPMAEAVMAAMVFSFILSRTLVPTMAKYLLQKHAPHDDAHADGASAPRSKNPLVRFQQGFEALFIRTRDGYHDLLELAIEHRKVFVACFLLFIGASFILFPFLGRNFFPSVDGGQILMHVRAPVGTRVEETAAQFADVQKAIREIIPRDELRTVVDNAGTYISAINTIYNNTGTIGEQDGDISIALNEDHAPTEGYVKRLREELPRRFPGMTFSFLPADIVSQILNFGSPAPIDLQIRGNNLTANFAYANKLLDQIRHIPGVADARIQQSTTAPRLNVDVDRSRAQYAGVTERDVTNSMVVNLAGSSQVAPTFWLNPQNGVSYPIVMQTPQYQIDSLEKLKNLPINASGSTTPVVLGGVARITRGNASAVVSQYDIQPMVEIYATTQGRDLGGVAAEIQKVLDSNAKDKPKGTTIALLGQVKTMNSAFTGLLFGLLGAIVLIYFLIVVNFQSWSDPFVIITALPAALAGIAWMLFATHTTLSVPALTGAIMCMGVATANSVLMISFAREKLDELGDATQAALEAGFVRLRPVLMTALAMIIGMLPMSLGLGEGGEQNAPLGRAVIGGLIFATAATLFFVPVVFSIIHRNFGANARHNKHRLELPMSPHDSRTESSSESDSRRAKSRRGLRLAGVAGAVIAVVIVAYGVISRASESSHLRDWTEAQALPTVSVAPPKTGANSAGLELPGRLEAYSRAPIFARVSGYLKSWKYDIGAKVKAGDLLAEIETPDLDQQLLQAKADLASAQANAALSATTAKRWTAMLGSDSVSKQEVDEKTGDFTAKQALVKAAQANVDRINAMKGFTRIVAPFDGIVTARETDVGALINAGSSGGQELFVVSDMTKLRVYVSVPQNYVPSVPPGTKATMTVPEHPDKTYTGTVDYSAQSVAAASGTTLMQIAVDNAAGELLPGSYASVHLDLTGRANALSIPSSALIFDAKGLAVATVDADNKVVLKPVTIARDLGKVIEIDSGLAATDRVIENPPDGVANGSEVRIAGATPKAPVAAEKGKNEKG